MKRLIFYFILVLGSVWLGLKIYQQPGYILIYYQQWAIETTTWFVALLLLLSFLLLHLIFSLLRGTALLPDRIEQWWQRRKQHKAMKSLNTGYINLLKGNWKKAEKNLLRSSENKELSFISYMIAADVANEQQALDKRDRYLSFAKLETDKKKRYVADAKQAQFLLKNHQPEEALTVLLELRDEHRRDRYLLKLLTETYLQLKDWISLREVLPDLRHSRVFDAETYHVIEKQTYLHLLKDRAFAEFSEVQTLWNKVPRQLRRDPDLLTAYAMQLSKWQRGGEAEELIRKQLKKKFDTRLMEYYVTTRSDHPAKQLALGEKYLKEQTDDPASLRGMGMLCLRNRLWGQARDYLERSLRLQPLPETYSALGYVYEKLGESEKALFYYRRGLKQLSDTNF